MPQSAAVRVAHEDDLPLLRQEGNPTSHDFNSATLDVRTLLDVWLRWRRCWIGSDLWPVRPRLTSNVITARSSADLKRPTLVVILHSPFVAADYAAQISHGSPSSTSVWMALTLHGSGRPRLRVCWRACGCHTLPKTKVEHAGDGCVGTGRSALCQVKKTTVFIRMFSRVSSAARWTSC